MTSYTLTIPTSLIPQFLKQKTIPLPTSTTASSTSDFTYQTLSTTRDYLLKNSTLSPVTSSIIIRKNFKLEDKGKGTKGTPNSGYNRVKQVSGLRKRWKGTGDVSGIVEDGNDVVVMEVDKGEKKKKEKRKRSEDRGKKEKKSKSKKSKK